MRTLTMSLYLKQLRERFSAATRKEKGKILDEFCATTNYHRKSAIRLFNKPAKFAVTIKISPHESKIPSNSTLIFIDDLYQHNDIVVEREQNDCFTFHLVRKVNDAFYLFDLKEKRKCIGRLEDFNIQGILSEIRTSKILRI